MSEDRPNLIFGCGYLGRRVSVRWRQQGKRVVAVTRFPSRAEEFAQEGLIPHVSDVCNAESLAMLPDADCVLFAVGYDRASGRTQQEVFVAGLRNAIEFIGTRCRRFVYISSTSVYGQADGSWVDETSETVPVQPGGLCCLAAEQLVRTRFANRPGAAIILRFAGIYGPDRLLARSADLHAGRNLPGDPHAWLNLIHVDDGVRAVIAANDIAEVPPVVLVADDRPVTRGDYYATLAKLIGAQPPRFDPSQSRPRGSGGLNKRCTNRVLRESLGVTLQYPNYESGLVAALGAMT